MTHVMGTMASNSDGRDESWYMDSGASNHMTCHGEWFDKMLPTQTQGYVVTGDDTQHAITHIGSVPLRMHDGRIKNMSDVLYVPSISKNLASVGQMVEQGLQVRFNKHGCFIVRTLRMAVSWWPRVKRMAGYSNLMQEYLN